jgi:hypothetical protein
MSGREFIPSEDDKRVINNSTRQQYRVLSDAEKAQVARVKGLGAMFIDLLHEIGCTRSSQEQFASRDLSLANTHMEDAVMRAVRHITK